MQPANFWRSSTTAGQQAPTNSEGSNNDPNPQERERPQTGYRPISLTSCVGKTMERVVSQRLKWYLETNDLLAPEQACFRQFRATEDQTTYLAQEIIDAFQEKKVTRVAWVDIQRAFNKVCIDGLIVKLMRNEVPTTSSNGSSHIYLTGKHESVLTNSAVGRSLYAKVSLKAASYPRPSS